MDDAFDLLMTFYHDRSLAQVYTFRLRKKKRAVESHLPYGCSCFLTELQYGSSEGRSQEFEKKLSDPNEAHKPPEFTILPGFDTAMRKLASIPKEAVSESEKKKESTK